MAKIGGNWFYLKDDKQVGPMPADRLQELISAGQVSGGDHVWMEGTERWIPWNESPFAQTAAANPQGARAPMAQPAAAYAQPQVYSQAQSFAQPAAAEAISAAPVQVAYYTPNQGMPPRAGMNLAGHASPSGDVGDWPLDDARFNQFVAALKIRKSVTGAAQLFRLLLLLTIIGGIGVLIGLIGLIASSGNRGGTVAGVVLVEFVILVGLAIFYYLGWRYTMRSHRWPALTMFILCMIGIAGNVVMMALGGLNSNGAGAAPLFLVSIFSILLTLVFAFVAWRAFSAIPEYLQQPAWCQELIAKSGL